MNVYPFSFKKILFLSGALIAFHVDSYSAEVANMSNKTPDLGAVKAGSENDSEVGKRNIIENDEPSKMVSTNSKEDSDALSKLKIADDHRNGRTNFGYRDAPKEALRLYKEVMEDTKISPDVRARAKINYADVYGTRYWFDDSTKPEERNNEALRLLNEVIHETSISGDFKGWAKRHLSALYSNNNFDMEPAEAKRKSVLLLEEVARDPNVSAETKGRAKQSLGQKYMSKDVVLLKTLGITEDEGKAKAIVLFTEVMNDTKARPDLRAECKLSAAEASTDEDDFFNEKLLKAYKEVILDQSISNIKRAEMKSALASKYLWGDRFNLKMADAAKISLVLKQEIANDKTLPIKKRLEYKKDLKNSYEYFYTELTPSENYKKILEITTEIINESKIDAKEYFKARFELANDYSRNRFKQKRSVALAEAKKIYIELLSDKTLDLDDKIKLRLELARCYQRSWWSFEPVDGSNDVKTATLVLYNEVLAYPDLKQEKWFDIKCDIARMHQNNSDRLNMKKSEGKAEALRLYSELLEDKKLTADQKKKIKTIIEKLEK